MEENNPLLGGPNHIFLLGFMGAGKTTLGKALAKRIALPFLDLDNLIEATSGRSIADIFTQEGDYGFRELEHQTLLEHLPRSRHVVATGGGTPCYFGNMDIMNQWGQTVYLSVTVAELHRRLEADPRHRPLLHTYTGQRLRLRIEQLLLEREPYYSRAKIVLQRDNAQVHDLQQVLRLPTVG